MPDSDCVQGLLRLKEPSALIRNKIVWRLGHTADGEVFHAKGFNLVTEQLRILEEKQDLTGYARALRSEPGRWGQRLGLGVFRGLMAGKMIGGDW